ncbi:N-6 DNA methylase [Marinobacter salarius]|uniref:N-6 DNA methylase n=1 Tax=Marinobacter salarius TaxID=1420917 RepID=UPI003D9C0344
MSEAPLLTSYQEASGMNDKATNELAEYLHRYIDVFRKISDYKTKRNLSLLLLFWRIASSKDLLLRDLGNDPDEGKASTLASFSVPSDASFFAVFRELEDPDIADQVERALRLIADSNDRAFHGVVESLIPSSWTTIGDVEFRNRLVREALVHLASNIFEKLTFNDEANFRSSHIFEPAIQVYAELSHKRSDAFCTSDSLASLLANLLSPSSGESVYDPACGSASLLLKCAQYAYELKQGAAAIGLYGQELNASNWAIAKLNALLSPFGKNATLHLGDSIRDPKFINADGSIQKFDIAVSNIPFSLKDWGEREAQCDPFDRFQWGVPPRSSGDYAFISHMLSSLNEAGRMAVVVPNGVLFRGSHEGKIRKSLVQNNLIDAVIGLPAKLLYDTSIPCSVLCLRKNRASEYVLFIDASNDFNAGKLQNSLSLEHISKISQTVKERKSVERYSCEVSREEIANNDFNLNISRYVQVEEEKPRSDINALFRKQRRLTAELHELDGRLDSIVKRLGVGD